MPTFKGTGVFSVEINNTFKFLLFVISYVRTSNNGILTTGLYIFNFIAYGS